MGEYPHSRIPLLQAIMVCMKETPGQTIEKINIPKPTYFSENPGTFNPVKQGTPYYFNFSLRSKLDSKLEMFLQITSKLELPYDKFIKPTVKAQKNLSEDEKGKNDSVI